ncbi:ATP-binding cassette transporter snq2 [Pichia californica]|uniref:ATP-binding cassette transporter snq2 n=1 Tax=Pichia californica TaxID=460514 RepID=A0A9P6WPT7_9ASCO|nr:ATP-binding cassette transporter snq2 [[Candida] californica]
MAESVISQSMKRDSTSNLEDEKDLQQRFTDLNETIRRSVTNNPDDNVMTRLSTLSKTLSKKTANDMEVFQLSPHDFELEKILKYLVSFNESNGYDSNKIDVIFKDLTVIGKNTAASVLKDFSDIFLKPFVLIYNRIYHIKSFDFKSLPKTRKIIRDVTGFAAPGTITLVLGRPGAGCSTFLKALSGEIKTYKKMEGHLTFNGVDYKKMFKMLANALIYNPELDVHFPFLTVEQTLKFAITCKTPTIRYDNKSREEYIENIKDLYEILFGLKYVEKTLVGSDFVRGISGGQRKRVSIAEAMVTNGNVYCYDNATRGLDASTALEFIQALRTSTNIYKTTSVATIYQASENIYELFDNVTILYLGRQIYFGPCEEAVQYFQNLGFLKHPRQTSSEFLTVVTDPLAREIDPSFKNKMAIPNTADEFETVWKNSPEFKKLHEQIDNISSKYSDGNNELQAMKQTHNLIKQKHLSKTSVYTINYWSQLKAVCKRRAQITLNNRAYPVTLVVASTVQSLIMGSLLYNITHDTVGAFSRGGVIFFSCLYFAVMTLSETPSLFLDKPILNKQRGYKLYHPSAELLAKHLIQFPVRLFGITAFAIIVYFLTHLKMDAGAFFEYYLFIVLIVQAVSAVFVMLASLMPNDSAAMGICGICMLSMVIYSSYMIQRPSMYWWFKWFSYCNPVLYAFESMILMQFRGLRMPCSSFELIPRGPGYSNINTTVNQVCGFIGAAESKVLYNGSNDVNGEIYLKLAFTYTFNHVWRNLGIMFAFIIGYIVISCVIVEVFNPTPASSDQLLFIKTAKISKNMIEHFKQLTGDKEFDSDTDISTDLEKNDSDIENVRSQVSDFNSGDSVNSSSTHRLGSDDIFTWKNVDYVVPYEGEKRKLLDNIQGYVRPGTLTALMGESGAGKTTLLNVLSRRTDVGVVTGDLLINGKPMTTSFERRTGYVQQQDLHIPELTVKESLMFSARLRRPQSVPEEEKLAYVELIMKILHMEDYADSIAGIAGYGLNVEQRKKLSIATELAAKPSLLLFLDEPTSGLDSQSSWAIVKVLKDLAAAGQAILCTIHQPSATLFEQFDRLLLLKKGGQTVYFGDIGSDSRTVINYFEKNGGRTCNSSENPAEYILDVIGAGATASVENDWFDIWSNSEECHNVSTEIDQLIQKGLSIKDSDENNKEFNTKYATSYQYQFRQVLHRSFIQIFRSVRYIMPKFVLTLLGGLLIGFSFWNVKHTVIGMQNVMFANFLTMIISAPLMNQIQGKAITSRELFEVRESKSNTFHWSCLLISHYLNEIPYGILFSTIFFVAWYFPIQLDNEPSRAGFWWFSYCFCFQLYYPSFSLMILYPSPDLPSANILLGLFFSITVAFCGVIQKPMLMPGFWKFMWRLSPMTYFIGNQVSTLLHDRPVHCGTDEFNYLEPPSGMTCGDYLDDFFKNNAGYVANGNATSNCAVCQYSVGDDFLDSIEVSYYDRWRNSEKDISIQDIQTFKIV